MKLTHHIMLNRIFSIINKFMTIISKINYRHSSLKKYLQSNFFITINFYYKFTTLAKFSLKLIHHVMLNRILSIINSFMTIISIINYYHSSFQKIHIIKPRYNNQLLYTSQVFFLELSHHVISNRILSIIIKKISRQTILL